MLIGGSGLLLLTPYFEIPELIRFLSIVIALLLLPLLFFKRKYLQDIPENMTALETQKSSTSAIQKILSTYRAFFSQSGIKPWLLVLVTYKIADSLGSTMFKPMLVDRGVLLSEQYYNGHIRVRVHGKGIIKKAST